MTMFRSFSLTLFLLSFGLAHALTVGSNSAPSRQAQASFSGVDNKMQGFGAFENGFLFEDETVTCSFDSMFPVSGTVDMNGGALYLQKDLIFADNASIESIGSIYGSGHRVSLSPTMTTMTLEDGSYESAGLVSLHQTDIEVLSDFIIYSLDWSPDGNYLAATSKYLVGIYEFDEYTGELTFVTSADTGYYNLCVRWHPTGNYLAVGKYPDAAQPEIYLYEFANDTLTLTSSVEKVGYYVTALDWSPDGNHLASGQYTLATVDINSFSEGQLAYTGRQASTGPSGGAWINCTVYDPTGEYLAVGMYLGDVRIYHDDGFSLTEVNSIVPETLSITGLDWSKTGDFIAMGMTNGTDRLRVYHYNTSTNVLDEITRTSVGSGVYSLHWNSDHSLLLVGLVNNISTELRVYRFVDESSLLQVGGFEISTNLYAARWRNCENYFAAGDVAYNIRAFSLSSAYTLTYQTFYDTNFDFYNKVEWNVPSYIGGNCTIDAHGEKISLVRSGRMQVASGGQMTIKNATISLPSTGSFCCLDDLASIVLQDCKLLLDNDITFSNGSFVFRGDVTFSGGHQLVYTSDQVSTITSGATLKIADGATFRYAPASANRDLLAMTDRTSKLFLDNCTLKSTTTGLRLTNGTVLIDNDVIFSCDGTVPSESICFGNGTQDSDVDVKLFSGAQVEVYGGLRYDNVA